MKQTRYSTIIFDIDDTLLDFAQSEHSALHNTFMKYDMPTGFFDMHDSYRAISKILWNDLEQGRISLQELGIDRFQRLFLEHSITIDPVDFSSSYLTHLGNEVHLMAGAMETLEKLTDCQLVIMTNGFGKVQKSRLEHSQLLRLFDYVIISEEAGSHKPHRGIFDYAFSRIGMSEKGRTVIVGDSLASDIQGGQNFGIDTIWYNPKGKKNSSGIKPTYEIQNLLEVVDIVTGNWDSRKGANE